MNTFDDTKDLNAQEVSNVSGGDYEQGHGFGSAVRNLISEVGHAVGGFLMGITGN